MFRIAIAAAAVCSIAAMSPAFAQSGGNATHNQASVCQNRMEQAQVATGTITSADKKTMAMNELDMAKTAMSKGDETGCLVHVTNAEKASK